MIGATRIGFVATAVGSADKLVPGETGATLGPLTLTFAGAGMEVGGDVGSKVGAGAVVVSGSMGIPCRGAGKAYA